ncbi:hypothetical protein D3C81_2002170 [compost metagenome]
MPIRPDSWMKGIWMLNMPSTIVARYTSAIPPVAATTPSLKFSVALISPLR